MKRCVFCDTEFEDEAVRCSLCGRSLFQHAKSEAANSEVSSALITHSPITARGRGTEARSLLAALLIISFGCFCLWLLGRSTTLSCTRTEQAQTTCTLQPGWAGWGVPGQERHIPQAQRAWTEQSCGSDEEGRSRCTYYVRLASGEGTISLMPDISGPAARDLVEQINRFIESPEAGSLKVSTRDWTAAVWGGCISLPIFILGVGVGCRARRP